MSNTFLVSYSVKGVKTLDKEVSLSFYKKALTSPMDTQNYNIKGIYGMNGSGKSAIIASVDILRNLITDVNYLSNMMVQKHLDAIIHKKTKELCIGIKFCFETEEKMRLYNYKVILKKNTGRYEIESESLSYKNATSKKEEFIPLVEVKDGEISYIDEDKNSTFRKSFRGKTVNRLSNSTIPALLLEKHSDFYEIAEKEKSSLFLNIRAFIWFGIRVYVYMDQSDDHTDYLLKDFLKLPVDSEKESSFTDSIFKSALEMKQNQLNIFSDNETVVPKEIYKDYEELVGKLQEFIQIFKSDLIRIDIDKKEFDSNYVCRLNMVYDSYSIDVEFESTGIKKLIKLFTFLQKMVEGNIVFIDELDSNLHDVYLCALLEYLMEYGKGQLCFTTHNVGPMDVLKKRKKSIDFLSVDRQIYPWTKNGNYSPSKLYKSGMIEGSPFNVDSFDFIGILDSLDAED